MFEKLMTSAWKKIADDDSLSLEMVTQVDHLVVVEQTNGELLFLYNGNGVTVPADDFYPKLAVTFAGLGSFTIEWGGIGCRMVNKYTQERIILTHDSIRYINAVTKQDWTIQIYAYPLKED